jgi:hypothetical protein
MVSDYLIFYFDIAFNDADKNLMDGFIGNKKLLDAEYMFIPGEDYYVRTDLLIEGEHPVFETTIISKDDYLVGIFRNNKKLILSEVSDKYSKLEEEKKKEFVLNLFNELVLILKKIRIAELHHQDLISKEFFELSSDLYLMYKDEIVNHKLVELLKNNSTYNYGTFFDIKPNVKQTFFVDLYDVCIELFLVDDLIVEEDQFIDVFTMIKPNPELEIKFSEKNFPIAYFLESLQPFFNNFNFTTIEHSKSFLNKQGKLLTATDLSTSKSRNKNKTNSSIPKIERAIESLKIKHLT